MSKTQQLGLEISITAKLQRSERMPAMYKDWWHWIFWRKTLYLMAGSLKGVSSSLATMLAKNTRYLHTGLKFFFSKLWYDVVMLYGRWIGIGWWFLIVFWILAKYGMQREVELKSQCTMAIGTIIVLVSNQNNLMFTFCSCCI